MIDTPLAESILAVVAGRERAAALYGDLLELAQSHGRAWFVAAYVRTLFSLTWRPGTAFLTGLASLRMIFWLLFEGLHAPTMQTVPRTPLTVFCAIVVAGIAAIVWFAMPFLLIRFGRNDRLFQLSAALFLTTLPGFSVGFSNFSVPLLDAAGLTTLAIVAAALCSRSWRRAGTILAATITAGSAALVVFFRILDAAYHLAGQIYPHQNNSALRLTLAEGTTALAMLVAAAVCLRLHHRLFRSDLTGGVRA
jgi:hypothetical protein